MSGLLIKDEEDYFNEDDDDDDGPGPVSVPHANGILHSSPRPSANSFISPLVDYNDEDEEGDDGFLGVCHLNLNALKFERAA